ncbi:MAG: leucyl aminopeptidase [Desulfuromonadales bacterium]
MEVKVKTAQLLKQKTPCLLIGVFEDRLRTETVRELDDMLEGSIERAIREKEFAGKARQLLFLHAGPDLPASRVLLVGLGKRKGTTVDGLRQAAGSAGDFLQGKKIARIATDLATVPVKQAGLRETTQAVVEGMLLATYRFDRYRTQKREELPEAFKKIEILVDRKEPKAEAERGVEDALSVCQGVTTARDMVNEPGNIKSPEYFADQARMLSDECGLECRILDRSELGKEGMGAMLGVAQGSVREPKLIVMEHRGADREQAPVALIGKGVMFDAGGISLKPSEGMQEMKMDMGGGAAVLGAMAAVARLGLPINVVGLIPAVENMPSGSAIRPGDVLTSRSGKTIEVVNTDAEGRLILADALTYAERFKPAKVIDVATLTGACVIALGHHASAVLGSDDKLVDALRGAGDKSGERLWPLPLWDEYDEQLKSDIADVKNVGGRPAGTITAAAFLKRFAGEYDWAHLDIAGTAWESSGRPYIPKGGTGVGVRLLVEFLRGYES